MTHPEFERMIRGRKRHDSERGPRRKKMSQFQKLVIKAINTNASIEGRLHQISESIEGAGFPFYGMSFGHPVEITDGSEKRTLEFRGDILEGTGIVRKSFPMQRPLQQEAVSLLIDPMGHGTAHRGKYGGKPNSELFHSNIRLRNEVIEPWMREFKKRRLKMPNEDPTSFLINLSQRLHENIESVSRRGGVQFGQGGLFYTRRLPIHPGEVLDSRHHFVELIYIPFGSESFLVQGNQVQRLAAGEEFKLKPAIDASGVFAANYGTAIPHNKIPGNKVVGVVNQSFEVGRHIFLAGEGYPGTHLFFASDGLLDEENAEGTQFKQILIPSLPRIFEHAVYPANINLNIMKAFKTHLGKKQPSDDTTFAVQQLH